MRMHLSLITRVLTTCLVATAAARPAGAQGLTALAANRGQAAAPATPSSWVDDNIYRRAIADGGRIWSMGQPPLLRWQAGVTADTRKSAGLAVVGAQKGFLNPLAGVMAVRAEGVIGASDQGLEGGGRLLAVSPLARMHFGLDYDVRDNRANWLIGTEFNIRRGGIFGRGTRLRLDWIPGRDALQVGVVMPVRQFAGRTRPSSDKARVQAARPRAVRPGAALAVATREFRAAADAVTRLVMPMRTRLGGDAVQAVAPDVAAVQALGRSDEVLSRMVAAWPRLFRAAAADQGVEGTALDALAVRARRIVLEDVVLPFDGMFGQRRTSGSLYVFTPEAERRFGAELATAGMSAAHRTAALAAFHAALRELDGVRADIRREWHSDRRVFLPLQVAMAPEEADSQLEIDALIERATGQRFSEGNRVDYVVNEAFQFEFSRTVGLAQRYHVLWIHDVRGRGETGEVDRVSALHVREYLEALTDRVQRYEETGALTQYFIILDEYFYETNNGRRWMTLLEHPLTHEIALPPGYSDDERRLRDAQQALRTAVAESRLLQEQRARFGDGWLQNVVKVHVNITHPSDFSFWGRGLFPLVGIPDNLMRDHRKIVFYDLSEADPQAGEVVFSGMGLGEHYAGATWEDRALIVKGPAALAVKDAARRLFLRQGFAPDVLPDAFQDRPLSEDYASLAEAAHQRLLSSIIPSSRVLQTHNDVGYGVKTASVSKAILLSVMPRGSVLISPDSLWEDFLWGSLLTGSALRGCRVLIIAPSYANAPGNSWLVMTRIHMLVSRLLALSNALDARLTDEGGLLKVGFFDEKSGVGDMGARVRAARRTFAAAGDWLPALIPFGDATLDAWAAKADALSQEFPPAYLVDAPDEVRPKLHMKGLFAVSSVAWDGLFGMPEMAAAMMSYLEQRVRQVSGQERDVRTLPETVWKTGRELIAARAGTLTPDDTARFVQYLQIGSFNMNDRSMLLDGEVELTVSGLGAQSGLFDFVMVCGLTTWLDRQDQIDALVPPPSTFHRLVARWGRSIL